MDSFDIAVIGGGPGGYTAAEKAARLGKRVVLFEERELGGTCLNRGCIPTKALLRSAEAYHKARNSSDLGVSVRGVELDTRVMHERKKQVVETLQDGVASLMLKNGVTVIPERARIAAPHLIKTSEQEFEAENIIVATGSAPAIPPIEGIRLSGVYTSDDLLSDDTPSFSSIVIVGGGVIGLEFANMYSAFGIDVSIVEAADRILPTFDKEVSQRMGTALKKRGVEINVRCRVTSFTGEPGAMQVTFEDKRGNPQCLKADGVLVAVGRTPSTRGLFEEGAEPHLERGALVVDELGQTSIPNIYAIGDVRYHGIQLAHVAAAQAENVVSVILGRKPEIDEHLVPGCVYTFPEIAQVGMTEIQAKESGIEAVRAKALASANGKCLIEGVDVGMAKVVAEKETGKILGAQLVCPHATDMIAELALAIRNNLTVADLVSAIHPHPTVSEMIRDAAAQLL